MTPQDLPDTELSTGPRGMKVFRTIMLVLATVQAAFAGLTAMVGAFADGGDVWSRLLIVLLHPLSAAALLVLVVSPRPAAARAFGVAALLTATVTADVTFALLIAQGAVKGDWGLPLAFAAIPVVGIAYALTLTLLRPRSSPR